MTSTITGLGSGFDINGWVSSLVSAKQSSLVSPLQSKLSTLQSTNSALSGLKTKYSSLQSALQTFTKTMYDSQSDMWTNTKINSSDSNYATATSSGAVSAASVNVVVENIATATVAKSFKSLGSGEDIANAQFTTLANNQAKAGSFSMFVDNKEYSIDIKEDFTLQDVIDEINKLGTTEENSQGVLHAELDKDGYLTINATNQSAKLILGSSGDTSNIVSALKLYDSKGNGFKSTNAISNVNSAVAMSDEKSGLGHIDFNGENGTGTIKINGIEFEIDKNTSLNGLISKINGNADAHVKASYDSLTNKMILTSTQTGKINISLEEENTNLLNVLSLTEGTGDNERLIEGSQNLGENALVYINDNKVISSSNTITGESSGIANLSITIKKPTTGKDDVPASISLDIEPDYTKVKDALKTFVNAYNDVVSSTKSAVASDGTMAHDSSLSSILNTIKSATTTTSENDGIYTMLSQIGISTSTSDPTKLSIDDTKLEKALKENFESVKLLLSDGYANDKDTGIFDKLLTNVNTVLDSTSGFFTNKTQSIDSQITLMNSRIERANTQLSKYEARVTAQFNRMDSIMSQLSTQLSTFQAYLG